MTTIPASLRRSVIQRADDRCEYCSISQVGQVATFHIDHIIPVSAGGETTSDNLALACVSCSLRKGARQELKDLQTGETVTIFNPRQQIWREHFRWDGVNVVGLTATGRATVEALDLNRATMLAIRAEEELLGRHPPP
ncbi:HNH endonuclease [Phormidesmis priestleyi ULC007]|uniref:HNH endonuclease n=1 Tax=Phormidesmis priestleyi ULC007 TaxID=1920490 RepID=A0A2T1DEG5_9CYAN|nr:HNH endonuclease signature motif containing protein [Phormidesmis priestleyi]PSB18879.1 HNH endonuclease [Phormidesmis priestleyi ULC007]PZO50983.1 MAG: HNH endonuclease [Phormidesmis priestleyi]